MRIRTRKRGHPLPHTPRLSRGAGRAAGGGRRTSNLTLTIEDARSQAMRSITCQNSNNSESTSITMCCPKEAGPNLRLLASFVHDAFCEPSSPHGC
jgi:hypothetical protein